LNNNDYLFCGMSNGYFKIRRFPDMKIIKKKLIYNNIEIDSLQIIENGKYILLSCSYRNEMFILYDKFLNEMKYEKMANEFFNINN
jgi:hypothetical protein